MSGVRRYRRKPAEVEAIRWTGGNVEDVEAFVGAHNIDFTNPERTLLIWNQPEHQWLPVPIGCRIIKGTLGEFYPCAENVFEATFEPAGDTKEVEA